MKSGSKQGFTLVELLVVIGLLSILASLLFPALSRARERTRSARCRSNLHQVGLAMRMYLDETGRWVTHLALLEPFAQRYNQASYQNAPTNSSIWFCPSWKDSVGDDPLGNYSLNLNGCGDVWFMGTGPADQPLGIGRGPGGRNGRPEGEIVNPSDMIVMGEMNETSIGSAPIRSFSALPAHLAFLYQESFPFNRSYGYRFFFRHSKRANSLFGDGHVESAGRDDLIGKGDPVRRRWNYDNQSHYENWR